MPASRFTSGAGSPASVATTATMPTAGAAAVCAVTAPPSASASSWPSPSTKASRSTKKVASDAARVPPPPPPPPPPLPAAAAAAMMVVECHCGGQPSKHKVSDDAIPRHKIPPILLQMNSVSGKWLELVWISRRAQYCVWQSGLAQVAVGGLTASRVSLPTDFFTSFTDTFSSTPALFMRVPHTLLQVSCRYMLRHGQGRRWCGEMCAEGIGTTCAAEVPEAPPASTTPVT